METLNQLFEYIVTQYNKPDHLVYRGKDDKYYNISTHEFKERVLDFAIGFKELGVKPETKTILLSENRPEWHVVDFACHLLGVVVVPIFPTLIPEQIQYIIENSESEFVIVSNSMQADKIFQIRDQIGKVKKIIAMDEEAVTGEVISFDEIRKKGREQENSEFFKQAVQLVKPESLATIIYTSGTTGTPKGVMLSHSNFVSNFLACSEALDIVSSDKGLSFLPLSHAFERTVDYVYFYRGATIVYSSSLENVGEDLMNCTPNIMASVPRFFEKVKAKIEAKVEEGSVLKQKLFNWALKVGKEKSENKFAGKSDGFFLALKYAVADKLVLSKIRQRTGGNIRFFISGGAPLSAEVARFFFSVGLAMLEGYGLTETSPVISVDRLERPKPGSVGKVLPCIEMKVADDGEILVKGDSVMQGYYNMPAETAEVMINGWFHTGDIGKIDEEGYLSITDRKKQLIVTSGGKKVAPQAIEKAVEDSRYIEQVVLIGDKRNFISALIVPDFEALKIYADKKSLKINSENNQEFVTAQEIVDLIQKEVDEQQKHFSNYERIRKFKLLSEPFTIENGKLTPTMKVKRKVVLEENKEIIEKMYQT
ncbi:long-chain fatty acid--CoA ligase [candidate division KSB1 bacterium]|nr:long-chain fatty acid--CoA ligase [candidate division KSB1 bacterium]